MNKSFPHIRREVMASTALATLAIHGAAPVALEQRSPAKYAFGPSFVDSPRALYEHCLAEAYGTNGDVLAFYAKARGISREAAKAETFGIRYGMGSA